jgi:arylformamidase
MVRSHGGTADGDAKAYRGMDREALSRAYDSAGAFPDVPRWRQSWIDRSSSFQPPTHSLLDVPYGAAARQKVDVFPRGDSNAPTAVFFHGGFWSRNTKETFRFVTDGIHRAGLNAVFAGYRLAPEARMDEIVDDAAKALQFVHERLEEFGLARRRLVAVGWSSGAHLVATQLARPIVAGGLAVSGVYDLEAMRLSANNDVLHLDEEESIRNSPLFNLPSDSAPLVISFGAGELPEFQRQSSDYHAARTERALPGKLLPMSGRHHHSVVDELCAPDGRLVPELSAVAEAC